MTTLLHKHHVKPRHIGGTDEDGIILCTPAVHAYFHRILYAKHGRWQDKLAYQGLEGTIGKEEIIHRKLIEGARKGGFAQKGRVNSPEHNAAVSAGRMGIKHKDPRSLESRVNYAASKTGDKNPNFGKLTHNATSVVTPLGQFDSLTAAGKAHGISHTGIAKRIKSKPTEYYKI